MRKFLFSTAALLCLCGGAALGDYVATQGAGTTFFDFICFSTKHCTTATLVTSAGSETGIAALPLQISLANTAANATAVKVDNSAVTQPVSGTVTAAQGTAANLNATVVGTGTFAVQAAATLAAETTKVIGTTRTLGNGGAIMDFAGQNAASPANSWLMGGQFNTTPTTLTNGNASPLQLDNAGKLLVNCTGCSASGAITSWGGGTLGAMANYGSSPGAVLVPGVNASVTASALPTGAATSANQSTLLTDIGAPGDTVCATDTGSCSLIALVKKTNTNTSGAVPAGTNTIGTVGQLPYPVTAVPYTATATGTTGATTATLAGAASVTTYICGFSIRANATAAATGNATVTGTITATLNFTQWTAPNASGLGITEMIFSPCIPASATNTSIAVVSAAPGTGGVVSVTAWGYKL